MLIASTLRKILSNETSVVDRGSPLSHRMAGGAAGSSIRRLDGRTITAAEAKAFAKKTLDDAHVTGAQLAVLDRGDSSGVRRSACGASIRRCR